MKLFYLLPTVIAHNAFLHLTDIHFDPYYLQGSNPTTVCHRNSSDSNKAKAGKYGNHMCDTPQATFDVLLETLKTVNVDFVVYSGDSARHGTADPELPFPKSSAKYMIRTVATLLLNTLKVPIIPTLGNNDLYVHDTIGPNEKLLKFYYSVWKSEIPTDQESNFLKGGYFFRDIARLRIISLNTIYLYKNNAKVASCDSGFVLEMFDWFQRALLGAKLRGLGVYIVGHVPPIDDNYYPGCLARYLELVKWYSDIIRGQLFGHVNVDTFTLLKSNHAYGVVLTNPSVVPLFNPSYRVYSYLQSGLLLGYSQFFMNLTAANLDSQYACFSLEYQTSVFGLSDLSVESYVDLHERLLVDKELKQKYELYKTVSSVWT